MPFNGVGVFNRVYQWVQDAANGIFVDATRTDTDSNDIAAGLTNCVTRDGQSPWLANIPAGGFKITGLVNGINSSDSVNYGQVFNSPSFVTPSATTSPPNGDNSLRLATTAFAQQLAFQTALPAQSLGFLISNGTVASFSVTFTGFAVNEVKGADIASAATVNLSTATGNLVHITGTTNITAFTIPSGAMREVVFDGILTLTNSATLILPTGANITTAVGDTATIRGDGAAARITKYQRADGKPLALTPIGDHEVVVHTGNGFGSTNTRIRRYTTVLKNVGTAITYADSATLGSSFTINENGFYAITNIAQGGGTASPTTVGISINSAQLTTDIDAVGFTASNRVGSSYAIVIGSITRTLKLSAGDVIRSHYGTTANAVDTFSTTMMSIAKVNTP